MFEKIISNFPNCMVSKSFTMDSLVIPSCNWKDVCTMLRRDNEYSFNMLVCISAVDMEKGGIEVFAHLRSIPSNKDLIVKCILTEDMPEIDSLCELWQSAELYEDEVYDLFGVKFIGHPFLRRILLDDDFVGHPLRKNYGKVLER